MVVLSLFASVLNDVSLLEIGKDKNLTTKAFAIILGSNKCMYIGNMHWKKIKKKQKYKNVRKSGGTISISMSERIKIR